MSRRLHAYIVSAVVDLRFSPSSFRQVPVIPSQGGGARVVFIVTDTKEFGKTKRIIDGEFRIEWINNGHTDFPRFKVARFTVITIISLQSPETLLEILLAMSVRMKLLAEIVIVLLIPDNGLSRDHCLGRFKWEINRSIETDWQIFLPSGMSSSTDRSYISSLFIFIGSNLT